MLRHMACVTKNNRKQTDLGFEFLLMIKILFLKDVIHFYCMYMCVLPVYMYAYSIYSGHSQRP